MTKDNLGEAISGLAIGILGGLVLAEILNSIFGKKCPRCNTQVNENQEYCYNCGCRLK